ncbi:MAG TPA: MaoC/PaaZ C-terminal domain-containing protein [Thermoleophilaceae bacterium]
MMGVRELTSAPRILPLYLRAAAPLVPGASLLPFVPGGGGEVPELELSLRGAQAEPERVAAYARVCGFTLADALPATFPHVLAFPLHMAVMADGRFPLGAVGLVHVSNRIVQHRPVRSGEALDLRVHATPLEPHPRGRTFTIGSEARVGDELVWEGVSTMLRRGRGSDATGSAADGAGDERSPKDATVVDSIAKDAGGEPSGADAADAPVPPANAEWRLPGDLGRRYASVSGDRNPIHMHALTAKPLGFPRAIAHGMWTKARCLAALESRLPDSFAVEVRFRRPILLPGTVVFASEPDGDAIAFAVRGARSGEPHLEGRVEPVSKTTTNKGGKAS